MDFCIEAERIILRRFRDSDLEPFLAYRNDAEVAKYQGWSVPYSREKAYDFIQYMKSNPFDKPGEHYQLAVENKSTGELIGDVAFWTKKYDMRLFHIGYTIARPYWRQGYAFEAINRLLVYLFRDLSAHRVSADCDPDNVASFRLLEKLGFRREAHFIESFWLGDRWGDEYHYGMLEREWKTRP